MLNRHIEVAISFVLLEQTQYKKLLRIISCVTTFLLKNETELTVLTILVTGF